MKIKIAIACFLLLYLCGPMLTVEEDPRLMKSLWLEKFTRFVKWPPETGINDTSKPFVIGVIGQHPFGQILDNVFKQIKIKGKRVEIRYIPDVSKIPGCHLLYISASCKSYISDILDITNDKPILTVGNTEGFAEKGVMINMYYAERKIRFQISATVFRHLSLRIDPLLVEIASVVEKK